MDSHERQTPKYEDLSRKIDWTLLDSALTDSDMEAACRDAVEWRVASVTVRPSDIDQAVRQLDSSGVTVAGAVGFPDGTGTTGAKLWEGRDLLRRGAREIEWAINVAKHRSRQFQYIETELMQISKSCRENGAQLKVALPAAWLDGDLSIIAAKIAKRIEAGFIVAGSPAIYAALEPVLKYRIAMKAASVTTLAELRAAEAAGCTRFGSANPVPLLTEWKVELASLEAQAAAPKS